MYLFERCVTKTQGYSSFLEEFNQEYIFRHIWEEARTGLLIYASYDPSGIRLELVGMFFDTCKIFTRGYCIASIFVFNPVTGGLAVKMTMRFLIRSLLTISQVPTDFAIR